MPLRLRSLQAHVDKAAGGDEQLLAPLPAKAKGALAAAVLGVAVAAQGALGVAAVAGVVQALQGAGGEVSWQAGGW